MHSNFKNTSTTSLSFLCNRCELNSVKNVTLQKLYESFCFQLIISGSSLKSSGPVDVFIKLHSLLLRVPPINQLASSYLYRPFNQATNEICEKLFIYAANDSATLNICSNEFLKINMSSLSDRDIINQKLSRKCFKKTISVDDELLLSGLSRISRLQITSDRPVGILYGLAPSSMPNQSCVSAFEDDEGLVSWHFLPLSSTMGKLFVVVPWARSSDMLVIIIGKLVVNFSIQIYFGILT